MRHYLGPDVHMSSLGFTASEAYVGTAFSKTDISLFKATNDDIIEYLDLSGPEAASNIAFAVCTRPAKRCQVHHCLTLTHSTRSRLVTDTKSLSQPAMACGDTVLAMSLKSLVLIPQMVAPFYAMLNAAGKHFVIHHGCKLR